MQSYAPPRLIAVVLAAGRGRRFGSTKQLVLLDEVPMVRRVVDTVRQAPVDAVVLATGHDAALVHAAAGSDFFLVNEDYRAGMGSTLAQAARALTPTADGILVCLADQPQVPASHLATLREAWGGQPDRIVATAFGHTLGPPAVFGSRHFEALCGLEGDTGAKALFSAAGDKLRTVRLESAATDIDRPEDLDRFSDNAI
jgi:CTP:molybdopterin cytidylyltransferase MocA